MTEHNRTYVRWRDEAGRIRVTVSSQPVPALDDAGLLRVRYEDWTKP